MLRAYKYRIYPTDEQKVLLAKTFGCCRCKHRYTVIVDGLFVGYVCYIPWFEKHVAMKIRNSGHDMCEGFEMVDNKL